MEKSDKIKNIDTRIFKRMIKIMNGQFEKLIQKLLSGTSDSNFNFDELCSLLIRLSFKSRINGDHHIFFRDDIQEIINSAKG
jgi:hypothetical protein